MTPQLGNLFGDRRSRRPTLRSEAGHVQRCWPARRHQSGWAPVKTFRASLGQYALHLACSLGHRGSNGPQLRRPGRPAAVSTRRAPRKGRIEAFLRRRNSHVAQSRQKGISSNPAATCTITRTCACLLIAFSVAHRLQRKASSHFAILVSIVGTSPCSTQPFTNISSQAEMSQ